MWRLFSPLFGLRCPRCRAPQPIGLLTKTEPAVCVACYAKIVVTRKYDKLFVAFCMLLGFALYPFEWSKLFAALLLTLIALRILCSVRYKAAAN